MGNNREDTYRQMGEAIFIFNEIETFINEIISHHIKPQDPQFFINYFLNSSVTAFGTKIKMLVLTDYFDKKAIEKLRSFSNNRNVFAHSNRTNHFEIDKQDPYYFKVTPEDVIYKTTSSGEIKKIFYSDFIIAHLQIQSDVITILIDVISKQNIRLNAEHIDNLKLYIQRGKTD